MMAMAAPSGPPAGMMRKSSLAETFDELMESPAEMLDEQISSSLFDAAPMLRDRNVQEE